MTVRLRLCGVALLACLSAPLSRADAPKPPPTDVYGDALPEGAVARIGTTRLRAPADIGHIALSPDGKYLVAADSSRPLLVWDARTGALLREVPLPAIRSETPVRAQRPEMCVCLTFPKGDNRPHMLTNSGHVYACDLGTGKWSESRARPEKPRDTTRGALGSASPDGTHFVLGPVMATTGGLEVLALGRDKALARIDDQFGHFWNPWGSLSADNALLAALPTDGVAKVWDATKGELVSSLKAPSGRFHALTMSPDGKTLVGTYGPITQFGAVPEPKDRVLLTWDRATGKERYRVPNWEGHPLSFSPDGSWLVSKSGNDVLLADPASGKVVHRLKGHGSWVFDVSFSADGKRIATGGRDHTAIIWDATTGRAVLDFDGPRGAVDRLVFAPDGKTLFAATGGYDHACGLWDVETGARKLTLRADGKGYPLAAAFTPNGDHIVVGYGTYGSATGSDWSARLWSVKTGKVVREFVGHLDGVHQLAVSPGGQRLVTRERGKAIRLWDITTGKLERELDWVPTTGRVALLRPTAEALLALRPTVPKELELSNIFSGEVVRTFTSRSNVLQFAVSADEKRVLIVDHPERDDVSVCDLLSGKVVRTFEKAAALQMTVALSPDGSTIALTEAQGIAREKTVCVYDVKTGHKLHTFRGHSGNIASIAFSPDGTRLATGSWDTTALIWALSRKP